MAGVDLASRYAPYVSGAQVAVTGFKIAGGADFNTRFAKIAGTVAATVSVIPNGGTFIRNSGTAAGTLSQNFAATATNGVGPFTFNWVRITAATPALAYSGNTTATLTLSHAYTLNETYSGVEQWRVDQTDTGNGNVVASATINVDFEVGGTI